MARIDVRALRREQILDAAERLVAERGWAETTFADLCREANVSNGVLTHAFESKQEILLALWERLAAKRGALVEHQLASSASISDAMQAIARSCLEKSEDERRLFLLVLHYLAVSTTDSDLAERLRTHFVRNRGPVAERLRAAQADGIVRRDLDADVAAGLLQWLGIGIALGTLTGALDRRAIEALGDLVRRYLQPDSRRTSPD